MSENDKKQEKLKWETVHEGKCFFHAKYPVCYDVCIPLGTQYMKYFEKENVFLIYVRFVIFLKLIEIFLSVTMGYDCLV